MTRREECALAEVVIRSTFALQSLLPLVYAEAGRKNGLVEQLRWQTRQLRSTCHGITRGSLEPSDMAEFVTRMRTNINHLRGRNLSQPLVDQLHRECLQIEDLLVLTGLRDR